MPATRPSGKPLSTVLLILLTILLPPVGVYLVAGCGADFLINVCLTVLGYFPGHIHAFYLEYVYFNRRDNAGRAVHAAPGVYSENVNSGGHTTYGTVG